MPSYYKKTQITSTGTGIPSVLINSEATPVASFSSSYVNLTATYTATASTTGAPGGIVKYLWDLGDGTYKYGQSVTKTYSMPGTYAVKLTVTDSSFRSATVTNSVVIKAAVADYFNRADNTSTLGTAADGITSKVWAVIPAGNTFGISTNQAKITSGTTTAIAYVDTGTTGGTVQAALPRLSQGHARSAFLAFRVVDINNFWFAQAFWTASIGGQGIRIIKKVANVNTTLWTSDYTLSASDTIKVADDGTNVKLFVNSILQTNTAIADTTLNTGTKVGIGGSFASDPTTSFDNLLYWTTVV